MAKMKASSDHKTPRRVLVRISVHDIGGAAFEGAAKVRLMRKENAITLKRPKESHFYQASVEPGTYRLEASTKGLVAPARTLEVGPAGKTASAYLGKKTWPFYRLGENLVPFRPPGDLLAVAFPLRQPPPNTIGKLVEKIRKVLPLEPYPVQPAGEKQKSAEPGSNDFMAADDAIWMFRFTRRASPALRQKASAKIRRLIGGEVRVGIPVDLKPGQVKVIDNRFVVRFTDKVGRRKIETLVKEADGRILRGFVQSPNAWLVEFRKGDFRAHLKVIERWHRQGLLVYGEPDILAQLEDDVFPDDPPNDPLYPTQTNLTLQEVDEAWRILRDTHSNRTLGSTDICVASLDRGVDLDHPDIGDDLTDGQAQISHCFDFSGMRECTVAGYAADTHHGMGVYGIIAAHTDNGAAISGIAPNTHQIAMERPSLTSVNYPDVLLWAAGFVTGNISAGWPDEPLSPAADVICCSHGDNGLALSGIMDDTFQELTRNGRGGLGTLLVYSAGNGERVEQPDGTLVRVPRLITGFRTWAAHPNTMAIGNSLEPDATDGVERKADSSNFGPEIDVCARGTGVPSLNASGGEQVFGGTSASAPTVAAIASLMLSRNQELTWEELRDILRETAVQIDTANADPVGQWVDLDGDGVVDFSQWYGFGRVNAASAVRETHVDLPFFTLPDVETIVAAQEIIYMRRIMEIMRRFFDECPTPPPPPFDKSVATLEHLRSELGRLDALYALRARYMDNASADPELLNAVAAICRRNASLAERPDK